MRSVKVDEELVDEISEEDDVDELVEDLSEEY